MHRYPALNERPRGGKRDATGAEPEMRKYPRTHHLESSRRQPGDEDLDSVPFRALIGRHLVVEEKVDGANAGLSFGARGRLLLQSRGHFLTGGPTHWPGRRAASCC